MKGIKINFYSGPGAGKSTVAAILYAELKVHGFSTEMVREYAKELIYQGQDLREADLNTQLFIFANQVQRETVLKTQVDYIISDSPLLLNAYYAGREFLKELALHNSRKQDINVWIERSPNEHYEKAGRSHTEKQSKKIDNQMKKFLKDAGVNFIELKGTSKEKASFVLNKILKLEKRGHEQ